MFKEMFTESSPKGPEAKWTIQINFAASGEKTIWVNSNKFNSSVVMIGRGFDITKGTSFSLSNLQARREDFREYSNSVAGALKVASHQTTKAKAESVVRSILQNAVGQIAEVKITPKKSKEDESQPVWKAKIIVGRRSTSRFNRNERNGLSSFKTIHASSNGIVMIGGDDVKSGTAYSISNLQSKSKNFKDELGKALMIKSKAKAEKAIRDLFNGAVYHVDSITLTKA